MNPTPRTILITGAGGMLGSEVAAECERRGRSAIALDSKQLDITDREVVMARLKSDRPEVVINCAAWTDVDGCESDEQRADRVNHRGAANLAEACRETGALILQISTDYVFGHGSKTDDGRRSSIPVDATPDPLSIYGRTKLQGEMAVIESGAAHLIVRTSWLFAAHHQNFVLAILSKACEGKTLRVVDDQRGRPTFAPDCARALCDLVDHGATGVFHAANSGDCSRFELAREIVDQAALQCRVEPCLTEDFPRPAKRPAYSVLDCSGTEALIGPLRDWREALAECVSSVLDRRVVSHES